MKLEFYLLEIVLFSTFVTFATAYYQSSAPGCTNLVSYCSNQLVRPKVMEMLTNLSKDMSKIPPISWHVMHNKQKQCGYPTKQVKIVCKIIEHIVSCVDKLSYVNSCWTGQHQHFASTEQICRIMEHCENNQRKNDDKR